MRTYESFLTLISELEGDATLLERAGERNRTAWDRIEDGARDPIDWGALGYTLHSIYGTLENYFLRISKFFENDLPSDTWHRTLAERMALGIPDIRPPLITDPAMLHDVLDLLRFRHRFRNMYGEDLDPERTVAVQRNARKLLSEFPEAHRAFVSKLRAVAEAL